MNTHSRILIVDDERHNIKILSELLRNDYKIMAAKSGEQALNAVLGPNQPDLILLDIMMPGLDGYEVCKMLKADSRCNHIPVIFVSALDSSEDESLGLEIGAVDYITKPFKPVIVRARVRTHIQLKQQSDLLERMALLDALTEIPNRRSFDITIEKELRRASRSGAQLSLILIDIDFFKKFNDHYGHAEGDACLRRVARCIADCSRRPFDLAARYGGEEFAVILPETDTRGAVTIAEMIQNTVAQLRIEHAASNISPYISLSMGVASVAGSRDVTSDDLFKTTDALLYKAKENGRNQICTSLTDSDTQ